MERESWWGFSGFPLFLYLFLHRHSPVRRWPLESKASCSEQPLTYPQRTAVRTARHLSKTRAPPRCSLLLTKDGGKRGWEWEAIVGGSRRQARSDSGDHGWGLWQAFRSPFSYSSAFLQFPFLPFSRVQTGRSPLSCFSESLPQRTNLEWGKAACSEDDIQKCVAAGAFHPGELVEWRAPVKDETPTLSTMEDQFVILSLTHIICGLRVDASDFLVSVLEYYRLEWSHLTPNSITVLSIFAHLCEAYVEAPPTVEVFTHFYSLYHNMKGETTTLGAVYFRLRDRMKKNYPLYYLRSSQFMWVSLCFYAKVPKSCRLTFRGDILKEENNWNWKDLLPLSCEQMKQVGQIMKLSNQGLTGADIIHDYLKRRISPLRRRMHLACNYSGLSDPTRDSDKGEHARFANFFYDLLSVYRINFSSKIFLWL